MEIVMPQPFAGGAEMEEEESSDDAMDEFRELYAAEDDEMVSDDIEDDSGQEIVDPDSDGGGSESGDDYFGEEHRYFEVGAGIDEGGVDGVEAGEEETGDEEDNPEEEMDVEFNFPNPEDGEQEFYDDEDDNQEEFDFQGGEEDENAIPIRSAHRRMQRAMALGLAGPGGFDLGGPDIDWMPIIETGGDPNENNDFSILGRSINPSGRNAHLAQDMSHPLLLNHDRNAAVGAGNSRRLPVPSLPAFDITDGHGRSVPGQNVPIEFLQQLFSRARDAEVQIQGHRSIGASMADVNDENLPEIDKQINYLHAHSLCFTEDRWKQEAKLLYGVSAVEKAAKYSNHVLNVLLPPAYEAKVLAQKNEDEAKAEAEKARLIKEEKDRMDAEEVRAIALSLKGDEEMPMEVSPIGAEIEVAHTPTPIPEVVEIERIVVIVNGLPVDITGNIVASVTL